jgi:hypothetical protein
VSAAKILNFSFDWLQFGVLRGKRLPKKRGKAHSANGMASNLTSKPFYFYFNGLAGFLEGRRTSLPNPRRSTAKARVAPLYPEKRSIKPGNRPITIFYLDLINNLSKLSICRRFSRPSIKFT